MSELEDHNKLIKSSGKLWFISLVLCFFPKNVLNTIFTKSWNHAWKAGEEVSISDYILPLGAVSVSALFTVFLIIISFNKYQQSQERAYINSLFSTLSAPIGFIIGNFAVWIFLTIMK